MSLRRIVVRLVKPRKGKVVTYEAELLQHEQGHILVRARWEHPPLDVGCLRFEPRDHFYEHYWTDRWYNVCEVHDEAGRLKGWYCNVTRPAQLERDVLTSEDLEIDLAVSADRKDVLVLDMDEFEACGFAQSDPATFGMALAMRDELERMARTGAPPFDGVTRDWGDA